ncbi:uncharacterized protein METZ01_LOCUS143762, partial [marine metagenome]
VDCLAKCGLIVLAGDFQHPLKRDESVYTSSWLNLDTVYGQSSHYALKNPKNICRMYSVHGRAGTNY